MAAEAFTIRPFRSHADFRECVTFQEEVWGEGFSERVPAAILMGAQRLGGVSAGAFSEPDGRLLGFVFGMTGVIDGELSHWSDMLAVRPRVRDAGLGLALKRYQREVLLERGVRTMRWTFDPLMAKNAYLNIAKLGAVAEEYIPEMYGETGSPLHRGIGTDRLVAFWQLDSPDVIARMEASLAKGDCSGKRPAIPAGTSPTAATGVRGPTDVSGATDATDATGAKGATGATEAPIPCAVPVRREGGHLLPDAVDVSAAAGRVLIPVPPDIQALRDAVPEAAVAWRKATRRAFMHYLQAGYRVSGFLRGEEISRYLLSRGSTSERTGEA